MADIPLRTYVQQLDSLIERKQVDEVIAHCRHILSLYPKHLDTYRMLGKALLEKGRHGDAADIFQRVLSVMPDDFISHVGMSIVREDEANLDAAIWHMERAYEAAPANGAIQQELCRLFGRRDGVAPTKARLTRGALARMYAQGGLFLQAEAELKAALAIEADRIDLQTKLADVYWQTDQHAQAAQTSAAILQKLPYSLEANRILVNVFRGQGRANDAVVYRQRLEAIDPYEAFADPQANGLGAAQVDPAKVMVTRLEYVPGMEDSGSPDWLASIGAKFEDPAAVRAAADAQPDWLSGKGDSPQTAAEYQPGQNSVPDWLKDLDTGPAAVSAAQMSEPPDWLKDISGTPAQPVAAPGGSSENLPDWLISATGPLPADAVPDWMLKATAEGDALSGDLSAAPDSSNADTSTTIADLSDARSTAPLPPIEPAGEMPDWLKATAAGEADEELPDWLKAITSQPLPASQLPPADAPTVPIPASQAHAELPTTPASAALPSTLNVAAGVLASAQAAQRLPSEPAAAKAAVPVAEVAAAHAADMTAAQAPEDDAPTSLSDLPDWLIGVPAIDTLVPSGGTVEPAAPAAAAAHVDESPAAEPVAAGIEMPDWLKNVAPVDEAATALEPDAALSTSAADLPDWLQSAAAVPPEHDETPVWLQGVAAVPPERDETPVWLQTAPAAPSLVESSANQEPAMEIPDWLKDLSAATPPDAAPAQLPGAVGLTGGTEAPAAPTDLPDYLQIASPEAIARAEQPLEFEPEDDAPEEEEPAMALPAEIPEWLKSLAPVSPDPMLPNPPTPEPATAEVSPDNSLSWMDELTALAGPLAGGEPISETPPAAVAGPQPAATAETTVPEAANVVAGGLADDTLTAEIPPWAQTEEPGPTDTIVSWLAGKHVPDWLRQPANDAPGLPVVEWEPNAADASAQPAAADSLAAATAAPEPPAVAEAPATVETSESGEPDLASMDPEAAFHWLESLAAQQGANRDELFTLPAEPAATNEPIAANELAATNEPVAANEPATVSELAALAPSEPISLSAATPAETIETTEPVAAVETPAPPADLEEFLKATEAALPVEPLLDTAPSKYKQTPAAETAPEPIAPEMDTEAALRWLEGLAAQQGARPEELITAPEDRTLEAPQWVADELAAAVAPEPAPVFAASDEAAPAEAVAVQTPEPTPAIPATAEAAPVEDAVVESEPFGIAAVEAPGVMLAPEIAEPMPEPAAAIAIAPAEAAAAPVEASTPEPPVSDEDAEAEAAMRWLEGLAAQQGAKPEELLTAPEERTLETPAWISAHAADAAAQPVAEASPFESVAPAVEPAPEPVTAAEHPATAEHQAAAENLAAVEPVATPDPAAEPAPNAATETPEWIAGMVTPEDQLAAAPAAPAEMAAPAEPAALTAEDQLPAPAAAPAEPAPTTQPPAPAEAAPPPATGAAADLDKLSRLAERLGAARRAREAEMEARFAEQRNQQESARRLVEERLQTKRAEPAATRHTGPLVEPVALATPAAPPEPIASPAVSAPVAEAAPLAVAELPTPIAEPEPLTPAVTAAPDVSSPPPAPVDVPTPPPAAAETLAAGQAALAGQDYATAVTHFSTLVENGHHLDTVVQSLSGVAEGGQAPAPVLRVLGDAYVRTDQLQKALDTYRQALRRL